ncbi:MAG: lipocalin family protein [Pseudomonadota bacterium]
MKYPWKFLLLSIYLLLSSCTSIPKGIEPVENFELQKYLGKWYEIARLPHSFEEDLEQVTAEYSLREDGGVKVINRGFNIKKKKWEEAIGRAYFIEENNIGQLKVSFFGPFYGSYIVFELSPNYEYALISGPSKDYFWILARQPQLDKQSMQKLLDIAKSKGFDINSLILAQPPNK